MKPLVFILLAAFSLPTLAQITDEPDMSRPRIRLPELPSRTATNPGNLTNPGPGGLTDSGRPGTPGRIPQDPRKMQPVPGTVDPNISCPMVDNEPYKDLISAIQRLREVVRPVEECANDLNAQKLIQDIKRMVEVGTAIQGVWGSPESLAALAQDPKITGEFQSNVTSLVNGINSVTGTLQNASFLDSKCAENILTPSGAIDALSDLAVTIGPVALLASVLNPAVSALMPYAAGMAGVGMITKVVKNAADSSNLNMSDPGTRSALLKNICEFSKISKKVRFLRLAQSRDLDQVTAELAALRDQAQQRLNAQFSDRVFRISRIREQLQRNINHLAKLTERNELELNELNSTFNAQTGSAMVCVMGGQLSHSQNSFAGRTVETFREILKMQTNNTFLQEALLTTEEQLRAEMKKGSLAEVEGCAKSARSYFETIFHIVKESKSSLQNLAKSLDFELGKDPEYLAFQREESKERNEIEQLEKVAKVLESLAKDGAINNKMEIATQMRGMKEALFGTPTGFPFVKGNSPAYTWIDHAFKQQNLALNEFVVEMQSLMQDAWRITMSGRGDWVRRDNEGKPLRDKYGQLILMSYEDRDRQYFEDFEAQATLAMINPKNMPLGTLPHRVTCQRLENIYFSWAAATDFLAGQAYFCRSIEEYFDTTTEPQLVEHCVGRRDLLGNVLRQSKLVEMQTKLANSHFGTNASLVTRKLSELKCHPGPTIEGKK